MYDYLFAFPDKAAADAVMYQETEDGPVLTFENSQRVQVTVSDPDYPGIYDEDTSTWFNVGRPRDPRVWWAVGLNVADDAVFALPDCVVEFLRPDISAPVPVIDAIQRTKLTQAELNSFIKFEPIWAGSGYIFS